MTEDYYEARGPRRDDRKDPPRDYDSHWNDPRDHHAQGQETTPGFDQRNPPAPYGPPPRDYYDRRPPQNDYYQDGRPPPQRSRYFSFSVTPSFLATFSFSSALSPWKNS